MKQMKKIINLSNLFLFVIFCLPLYLVKVKIFNMPTNILEMLAIFAIIATIFKKKDFLFKQISNLPKIFLIGSLFIFVGVLTSIFSNNNILIGLGILKGWFLIPFLFAFLLSILIRSEKEIEKVFLSIYLSSALVGIIAIAYKLAGITTFDNRLAAFYLSPNYLAMYLSPGVFFGTFFLSKSFYKQKYSKKTFFHAITLTTILFGLYFTYSYGAWLAILFSMILLAFLISSNMKKILYRFFFLFCVFAFLLVSQINSEKISSLTKNFSRSSLSSRQMIWKASAIMIQEKFFLGIGPGNFQQEYLSLQPRFSPYLEWAVPEPHNIFLAFWLQAGLLGLIGFLLVLFSIFHGCYKSIKKSSSAALATPLLGFFLYTIVHGLIDTTFWKNDLSFLFWICAFLVFFLRHQFAKK